MTRRFIPIVAAAATLALATPALAHTGIGATHGLGAGLAHPFLGLDHELAMVTVGLLAARLGGRALVVVPLAFIAMMTVGAAIGATGVGLAGIEAGIAASIVVLGSLVALQVALPARIAAALAGCFAIFHGVAHGAEMPGDASGLAYGAGFVAATASLHLAGILAGLGLNRLAASATLARIGGGAVALAGIALLTGMIQT